jgi:hypothetical protein
MTIARSALVDYQSTQYYHCFARTVDQVFLYNSEPAAAAASASRKLWILEQTRLMSNIFAVDVCAYGLTRHEYHVVFRVKPDEVAQWDDDEIIRRTARLCPGCVQDTESWTDEERQKVLTTWRARLGDISWFMAKLCEYIARRANKEMDRKGKFWRGRFRSRALMDGEARLSNTNWHDLNPEPVATVQELGAPAWKSIQKRIREVAPDREEAQADG